MASTNLLFSVLAWSDKSELLFAIAVIFDDIAAAFATVAFVAFISLLVDRAYTATQYALFSSLMTLPGKFVSGFSGMIIDASGYAVFFTSAALIGLPAIILVSILVKRERMAVV